jgi:hypothetical protein
MAARRRPAWQPAVSVSELERHHIAVVPTVTFPNSSPLTAAAPLPDELTHEPYPAAGRGSNAPDRLRAADEDEDPDAARAGWFRLPYEVRLAMVRRGLGRMHASIAARCPGEHRYVRRNGRFPCCPECGFTDTGLHKSEIEVSHDGGRRAREED